MPTGTHFALLTAVLLTVTFVLALLTLFRPARLHLAFSLLVALVALCAMGSFEFVREAIRKPYVIANYLYANSLYVNPAPEDGGFSVKQVGEAGILQSAKWIKYRQLTADNQVAVGGEIFRVECQSCHTTDAYRGIRKFLLLRQWNTVRIQAMLGGLDLMHNGVMPPFAGTDAERQALAAFLSSVQPIAGGGSMVSDGKAVYERNCSMCHQMKVSSDPLFMNLPRDPNAAMEALKDLPSLFVLMPDLKLSDQERTLLVLWVNERRGPNRGKKGAVLPTQGGN
jgi:mono/diheme cytochrome c family protein